MSWKNDISRTNLVIIFIEFGESAATALLWDSSHSGAFFCNFELPSILREKKNSKWNICWGHLFDTVAVLYLSESSSVKKEEFTLLQNEEESTAIISQCTQPQEHIVFHKTHKCSSSTIQNILLRYSKNHRSLNHLLLFAESFSI